MSSKKPKVWLVTLDTNLPHIYWASWFASGAIWLLG